MDDTFRLSRIFAEGWKAAKALPMTERDNMETGSIAVRSPYANDPERSRWSEGFKKALGS